MTRGEIWYAVWPADRLHKKRPVLIVSNDYRNSSPNLHDVVVVKLTGLYRSNGKRKFVNDAEDLVIKLKKDTIIKCAAIYSIEKTSLLRKANHLPFHIMQLVDDKLKTVLNLNG